MLWLLRSRRTATETRRRASDFFAARYQNPSRVEQGQRQLRQIVFGNQTQQAVFGIHYG